MRKTGQRLSIQGTQVIDPRLGSIRYNSDLGYDNDHAKRQLDQHGQSHLHRGGVVSNTAGVVVERMANDPWAKRRFPNGTNDRLDALYGLSTERGYTLIAQVGQKRYFL